MGFSLLDWIVLGGFMLALLAIVVWVARQKEVDTEDYFLAGRNAGWLVIGASIFASNIGSEHLVGLASAGPFDRRTTKRKPGTSDQPARRCGTSWHHIGGITDHRILFR